MSYHEQGIKQLSKPQISKLLKGLKVRVQHGADQLLHISPEQAKKVYKAHLKGGAVTIQLDPYSIDLNGHLRTGNKQPISGGTAWTQLGRNTSNNLGVLSNTGTNYLTDQMGGDTSTPTAGAGIKRRGRPKKQALHLSEINEMMHIKGAGVNRMKKATRWEGFANRTIRDGIDTAGKAARVYYDSSGPMAQMGFGLKKRGRPRKSGGALVAAGY